MDPNINMWPHILYMYTIVYTCSGCGQTHQQFTIHQDSLPLLLWL